MSWCAVILRERLSELIAARFLILGAPGGGGLDGHSAIISRHGQRAPWNYAKSMSTPERRLGWAPSSVHPVCMVREFVLTPA